MDVFAWMRRYVIALFILLGLFLSVLLYPSQLVYAIPLATPVPSFIPGTIAAPAVSTPITLDGTNQRTNITFTIEFVRDPGPGWHMTLNPTQFSSDTDGAGGNPARLLPVNALALKNVKVYKDTSLVADENQASPLTIVAGTPTTIFPLNGSNLSGSGTYDVTPTLYLFIPANIYVSYTNFPYTSVFDVTIYDGP
jgi:hypothetical protein